MCRKARLRPSSSQDVLLRCVCIPHRTWNESLAAAVVETLAREEGFSILTLAGLDRAIFDSDLYIEFRVQVCAANMAAKCDGRVSCGFAMLAAGQVR